MNAPLGLGNFKGVFVFGSANLDELYTQNARKPGNVRYVGEYFCYLVNHGHFWTFNEWYSGQLVPEMTDVTKEQVTLILKHYNWS